MLENLAPQGFVMAKSKILDYPHLSLALRCLGEFHAYSFITRVANPTSFEKLKMEEHLFTERLADNNDDNKDEDVSKMLIGLVFKVLHILILKGRRYSSILIYFFFWVPRTRL